MNTPHSPRNTPALYQSPTRRKSRVGPLRSAALMLIALGVFGVAAGSGSTSAPGVTEVQAVRIDRPVAAMSARLLSMELPTTTTTTVVLPPTTTSLAPAPQAIASPAPAPAPAPKPVATEAAAPQPDPAPTAAPAPPPPPPATPVAAVEIGIWDRLADCESGRWDGNKNPIPNTRNWASTENGFQGGIHFAPSTWDRYRLHWLPELNLPADAQFATREQQIRVGQEVLKLQGAVAWPKCSRKVGLR